MKRTLRALACVTSLTLATAQDRPYREGGVDAFLADAKAAGRPAIVLFNFDAESG